MSFFSSKYLNDKQLPSCQKSGQNIIKTGETFYGWPNLKVISDLLLIENN